MTQTQGHRSWGLWVLTPENMQEGSEYVLTPKMSHSFVQNCCWIILQVSRYQWRKTCIKKWKAKLFFEAP